MRIKDLEVLKYNRKVSELLKRLDRFYQIKMWLVTNFSMTCLLFIMWDKSKIILSLNETLSKLYHSVVFVHVDFQPHTLLIGCLCTRKLKLKFDAMQN